MSTAPVETSEQKRYTAPEVAKILDCTPWFVKKLARDHGIGYNLRGPKGYRFLESDIEKMREVLRPKPAPARRRGKGKRR